MKGSQEWLTTGQITATKRASSTFWVDRGPSSCCQKGEEGRSKWHIWDTYCAVWWAPPSSMELTNSGIIKLSPTRKRADNKGNSKNEWECWDVHLIVRGPVAPVCEAHDQNLGLPAMCPSGPGSRRTLMLHLFGNSRRRPLSSTTHRPPPSQLSEQQRSPESKDNLWGMPSERDHHMMFWWLQYHRTNFEECNHQCIYDW